MKWLSFRFIVALLTFVVGVVAATVGVLHYSEKRRDSPEPDFVSWLVKVNTGGGLSGLGEGGWMVTSQGQVFVGREPETIEPIITFHYSCKGRLSPEDWQKVERIVKEANPSAWSTRYVNPEWPYGYADGMGAEVELHLYMADGGKKIYVSAWSDAAGGLVPYDLMVIYKTTRMIGISALQECQDQSEKKGVN